MASDAGLPLVGTGDVHYLTAADAIPHEAMLCIQTGDTLDNPNRFKFSNHGFYLRSPQEMYDLFAPRFGEDMLRNTVQIADRCSATLDFEATHLPHFDSARAARPPSRTCASWPRTDCESATARRRPSCASGSSSSSRRSRRWASPTTS